MFESVPFIVVPGEKRDFDIILFSLSTCAFCRKGMDFLSQNLFQYRYCHLDSLPLEEKQKIKDDFKAHFGKSLSYPTLLRDGSELVIGFIRKNWEAALGLPTIEEL